MKIGHHIEMIPKYYFGMSEDVLLLALLYSLFITYRNYKVYLDMYCWSLWHRISWRSSEWRWEPLSVRDTPAPRKAPPKWWQTTRRWGKISWRYEIGIVQDFNKTSFHSLTDMHLKLMERSQIGNQNLSIYKSCVYFKTFFSIVAMHKYRLF